MLKPRVEVHNVEGVLVAEFWDCLRLDSGAIQALRGKYEDHLRNKERPELVVDLLGVAFAGSASLGHFVALQRLARPWSGRVIFCNVDPTVFEVFRATKLVPLFTFVTDRAAALTEVSSPGSQSPEPPAVAATGTTAAPAATRKSDGSGLLRSSQRRKLS
jgi:anti-anti-sigma factor